MQELNIPIYDVPRVVILGGGFAGLRLAKDLSPAVFQTVLIDRNNFHTFQPLLYQVATAGLEPDSISYPLRKILKNKPRTHIRMSEVLQIDLERQEVVTELGTLRYDYLVIATGAKTNFFNNSNILRHSMPMKTLTEALDIRSLILQNFEEALNSNDIQHRDSLMNFVIVGGGPTGVELAGALAELRSHILPKDFPDLEVSKMQIHIIEAGDKLLGSMSPEASQNATKYLRDMGINVWTSTFVKEYDGTTVQTSKHTFYSKSLIWTAGVMGNIPPGIPPNVIEHNRILVDDHLLLPGYPNVAVIGDVALLKTKECPDGLPMLGSVAQQQGVYLAKMLKNKVTNKPTKPFDYSDKGTMATVGRNKAVVDLHKFKFGGIFAWIVWLCVHLMLLVDFRNRVAVFSNWVWNYISFDRGTRLIVRKFQKKQLTETHAQS